MDKPIINADVTEYQAAADAVKLSPVGGLNFIEQLQIVCKSPCTKNNTPFLIGVNENVKVAVLTKTTCKQWNCETCGARNASRWIAKVINGVNKLGGEWVFLTVTASRNSRGLSSVRNIRDGWKKLYNRILEKTKQENHKFHYVKVWEQHKDGSFHLHILANYYVPSRWLKDNAFQCGMGYQGKTVRISNAGQVAGYMAKYTLKAATIARGGVSWPKGLRRIETSQEWPELPQIKRGEEMGWIVTQSRTAQLMKANVYFVRGFEILDTVKD